MFLSASIAPEGWEAPAELTNAIVLTDAGEHACAAILAESDDFSETDARLATLCVLGGEDIYVDLAATDVSGLIEAASVIFARCDLQLVWSYGHVFADRLSTAIPTLRSLELDESTSRALLTGVPQAVAQVANLVVGPFGVCRSVQTRTFPPGLQAGPVACADPGCGTLHSVLFDGFTAGFHEAEASLLDLEPASVSWREAVIEPADPEAQYLEVYDTGPLPRLLANAFSESELRILLASLIDMFGDDVRPIAGESPASWPRSSAVAVPRSWSDSRRAACCNCCCWPAMAPLIEAVEYCLDEDRLPFRQRKSGALFTVHPAGRASIRHVYSFSRHGVSLHPTRGDLGEQDLCVIRLERLVRDAYSGERGDGELAWKLRALAPADSRDALRDYLLVADPGAALEELVFGSRETLERALASLRYGRFPLPASQSDFARLRDRMLWKLGFPLPAYPLVVGTFWKRLAALRDTAAVVPEPYEEEARERIRGEAVNFFVSTEEVLDLALSFVTWALTVDHFGRQRLDRFKFDLADARATAAALLSGRSLGGDEVLQLRDDGKNTLFPLVEGFRVFADYCQALLDGDTMPYRRPEAGVPFYAASSLAAFPFMHTVPLFDLDPTARGLLIDKLRAVSTQLSRAQVLDVRNRLEHRRDSFPVRAEIERALDALTAVVRELEQSGVCPTIFEFVEREVDRFGRSTSWVRNYSGTELQLRNPSMLHLVGLPHVGVPLICFKGAEIAGFGEWLRFEYTEPSEFRRLWRRHRLTSVPRTSMVPDPRAVGEPSDGGPADLL